jgi:hypothetical protein
VNNPSDSRLASCIRHDTRRRYQQSGDGIEGAQHQHTAPINQIVQFRRVESPRRALFLCVSRPRTQRATGQGRVERAKRARKHVRL